MHTAKPPQGRGWKTVGYSDFITLDGTVHNLRRYNSDNWVDIGEVTNGAAGINSISRHVCYAGGMDAWMKSAKDTRTPQQEAALEAYVKKTLRYHPGILIAGHNQFSPKACPSFSVPTWLHSIGIPKKNIY